MDVDRMDRWMAGVHLYFPNNHISLLEILFINGQLWFLSDSLSP